MAGRHVSAYRSIVREVRKSSISPRSTRNKTISSSLRAAFDKHPQDEVFNHDIQNILSFMKAQREYKVLLERYNPLVDLTAEERIHATARRVGLDMPVTHKHEK